MKTRKGRVAKINLERRNHLKAISVASRLKIKHGSANPRRKKAGLLKGKIWMAPDFDKTPKEVLDAFEGKSHLPKKINRLQPDPVMRRVKIKYDPTEPLTIEEWPSE
jgi:hypothetical protein